jgi:hypothetical protein
MSNNYFKHIGYHEQFVNSFGARTPQLFKVTCMLLPIIYSMEVVLVVMDTTIGKNMI